MAGAVATLHTVGEGNAVVLNPYGMTYLRCRFVGHGQRTYRSRRADLGTLRTLGTAVATLV